MRARQATISVMDAYVKERCPEKSLLSAIIIRAVQDILDKHNLELRSTVNEETVKKVNRHYCDAERWLTSISSSPFSFIWCCQQLFPDNYGKEVATKILNRIEVLRSTDEPKSVHKSTFAVKYPSSFETRTDY